MPSYQWSGTVEFSSGKQNADVTLSGSGQVIAGVAGKKIKVFGIVIGAAADTAITFESNATPISGQFPLAAKGGFTLPESEAGWFETAAGEALNLEASASTSIGIQVIYGLV